MSLLTTSIAMTVVLFLPGATQYFPKWPHYFSALSLLFSLLSISHSNINQTDYSSTLNLPMVSLLTENKIQILSLTQLLLCFYSNNISLFAELTSSNTISFIAFVLLFPLP